MKTALEILQTKIDEEAKKEKPDMEKIADLMHAKRMIRENEAVAAATA